MLGSLTSTAEITITYGYDLKGLYTVLSLILFLFNLHDIKYGEKEFVCDEKCILLVSILFKRVRTHTKYSTVIWSIRMIQSQITATLPFTRVRI